MRFLPLSPHLIFFSPLLSQRTLPLRQVASRGRRSIALLIYFIKCMISSLSAINRSPDQTIYLISGVDRTWRCAFIGKFIVELICEIAMMRWGNVNYRLCLFRQSAVERPRRGVWSESLQSLASQLAFRSFRVYCSHNQRTTKICQANSRSPIRFPP